MRTLRRYLPLATSFTTAALVSQSVLAQSAQQGEFSVQRFEPASGPRNYLSVEGLRMQGNWGFSAGLMFNYARDPFVIATCKDATTCDDPNVQTQDVHIVRDLFTWDLLAAISPVSPLQVGLRFPVAYVNGDGLNVTEGTAQFGGIKGFGVGDPNVEAKFRILGGATDPFALGAAVDASFPLGHAVSEGKYIGNDAPVSVGFRGIFDGEVGPASFGLNLRGIYRKDATLGSATLGSEFRYGAAAGYRLSPVFRVLAEGTGSTRFSAQNGTNTLEVDGAVQIEPLDVGLVFTLGAGTGVIEGVGVPTARAIAGLMWVADAADRDRDGIGDKSDQCPTLAEDRDGFEDSDGCPEEDNDGDRIADTSDKCPNQSETLNGYQDDDGCPDQIPDRDGDHIPDAEDKCPEQPGKIRTPEFYGCPDRDEDGVTDTMDKCPDQPEDTDGFEDLDGCPDPDNDKDGIADELDECVDVPEIVNEYKDEDGCPDELPDRDGDGIPDAKDKCPTIAENINGVEDEDGCPEKGANLVQVGDTEIKILQRVEFATNSDKIKGEVSFRVLQAVVSALKLHQDIFLVEVSGHTDNVGPADVNRQLSQKRAESVVAYLVSKGIKPQRLVAKGYGPDKPIADNKTPAGKQKNRRVEFNILKSTKVSQPPSAPIAPAEGAGAPPAAPAATEPAKPSGAAGPKK